MQENLLKTLFESYTGLIPEDIAELPSSGSNRRYFRIKSGSVQLIGVIGTSLRENKVFIGLDRHFMEKGIPVPKVLAVSEDCRAYLQEDLGEKTLFDMLAPGREKGEYSPDEKAMLRQAIAELPRLQFLGAEGLDWGKDCLYPSMDGRMIDFDLNYFKYCFLKASGLEFDEVALQEDFERLKSSLLKIESKAFMHRDFQARNIMMHGGRPWIIDFQGGRRGPIYYDVASFVYQARSRFPESLKQELLKTYLGALQSYRPIEEKQFMEELRLFVLFRTLQVLGAYGFRGYFEKKPHFIASVPYAMENLRTLLETPFSEYPYLNGILDALSRLPQFNRQEDPKEEGLLVHIYSFSYKKGIPADSSPNGGGYVFDCRSIHNPGRYPCYRQLSGMDEEVIRFLEENGEAAVFLESVFKLADAHVKRYLERNFTHLQICFGCTGGRHRSVYCAEQLAAHLAKNFNVKVLLTHREMKVEKTLR